MEVVMPLTLILSNFEATMSLAFLKPWGCISTPLRRSLEASTLIAFVESLKFWIHLLCSKFSSHDVARLPRSIEASHPLRCSLEAMLIISRWNLETTALLSNVKALKPLHHSPLSKPWIRDATFLRRNLEAVTPQARLCQSLEATYLCWNAAT